MENHITNSFEFNGNVSRPVRIEYLMHQYPWFTREQIAEVVEKENHQIVDILAKLDSKSGVWPELFGY